MIVAQFQMPVGKDKTVNYQYVRDWCKIAKQKNADIICLPEIFNCPYDTSLFLEYAEEEGGEAWQMLSELANLYGCYIVGGSIPELDDGKIYNTCYIFNRQGVLIGKHRKIHLFDIDIAGGQQFKESDTLSSGSNITIVDTEFGKIGVIICYDIRFPELIRLMALEGAKVIFVPAAFNMTTGPAHWELTFRMRALDNQVYMAGTASSRDTNANYISYGYSIITSPWGEVIEQADEKETLLINTIDLRKLESIREQLPLLKHRRTDIYNIKLIDNRQERTID